MLAEDLTTLATLAGRTVVAAATTDAWEAARRGFARLLSRGAPAQRGRVERRLDETRDELTGGKGALDQTRAVLEAQWATRLADLLTDHPDAEADLRTLVGAIQALLPAEAVSAEDHAVAAGRDVSISASGGGVAAG